jgi:GNAT superfamily N-acetyltransferase
MTDIQNLEIRTVARDEGEGFVALMNAAYSRKKSLDYFLWQYFQTPFKSVMIGAFLKERLIGSIGLQCRKLNNGLVGGQVIDIIVAEGYRKQGVFTKLAEYAIDYYANEMDFGFIFPNEAGRAAVKRALGWKEVGLIKTLFFNKQKSDSSSISGIDPVDDLRSIDMDNGKNVTDRVYLLRDKGCMRWRFGMNPEYKYFIVSVMNNFCVGKIFTDPVSGTKYGDIVDYGFEANMDIMKGLLTATICYFQEKGIDCITTWALPETAVNTLLVNVGFIESQQARFFCLKTFTEGLHSLYDFRNWLLVEADSEVY